MPTMISGGRLHVLYLLHGNGGSYREWSQFSGIVGLVPADWMLVMPEGESSYWMNSATVAKDRYEDFITRDLIADAERELPQGHVDRAIAGNSMGGFGAIVLAMKHPGLYRFAGAMSPPVDYPERGFSVRRWGQSMAIRSIFGADGSAARKADDPFVLARMADAKSMPYLWISAGDTEPLLPVVREFDTALTRSGIAHEFYVERGGHDWREWGGALPGLVKAMEAR
jgi:S-formylglutathione hydrolase FrmB